MPDEEAKWALWLAIGGPASRLVIAGLDPGTETCSQDTYSQYLGRLGEQFVPAAEGAGAVEEYLGRCQGRLEDIQSYVNAKHELFLRAYPAAQPRELEGFFQECSEGIVNKFVRDQMFTFQAADAEEYLDRAVRVVQVERCRIKIGDSSATSHAGLLPVTQWARPVVRYQKRQIPYHRGVHLVTRAGLQEDTMS